MTKICVKVADREEAYEVDVKFPIYRKRKIRGAGDQQVGWCYECAHERLTTVAYVYDTKAGEFDVRFSLKVGRTVFWEVPSVPSADLDVLLGRGEFASSANEFLNVLAELNGLLPWRDSVVPGSVVPADQVVNFDIQSVRPDTRVRAMHELKDYVYTKAKEEVIELPERLCTAPVSGDVLCSIAGVQIKRSELPADGLGDVRELLWSRIKATYGPQIPADDTNATLPTWAANSQWGKRALLALRACRAIDERDLLKRVRDTGITCYADDLRDFILRLSYEGYVLLDYRHTDEQYRVRWLSRCDRPNYPPPDVAGSLYLGRWQGDAGPAYDLYVNRVEPVTVLVVRRVRGRAVCQAEIVANAPLLLPVQTAYERAVGAGLIRPVPKRQTEAEKRLGVPDPIRAIQAETEAAASIQQIEAERPSSKVVELKQETGVLLWLQVDSAPVIEAARANCSDSVVRTARYYVEFVLNEENPNRTHEEHIREFSDEIQRVMDDHRFTEDLRYNEVRFKVVYRDVLDESPPGDVPKTQPTLEVDPVALKMLKTWSARFESAAAQEGWILTNNSAQETIVAKLDVPEDWTDKNGEPLLDFKEPKFGWDEDAQDHVCKLASAGSLMHQVAWRIHQAKIPYA